MRLISNYINNECDAYRSLNDTTKFIYNSLEHAQCAIFQAENFMKEDLNFTMIVNKVLDEAKYTVKVWINSSPIFEVIEDPTGFGSVRLNRCEDDIPNNETMTARQIIEHESFDPLTDMGLIETDILIWQLYEKIFNILLDIVGELHLDSKYSVNIGLIYVEGDGTLNRASLTDKESLQVRFQYDMFNYIGYRLKKTELFKKSNLICSLTSMSLTSGDHSVTFKWPPLLLTVDSRIIYTKNDKEMFSLKTGVCEYSIESFNLTVYDDDIQKIFDMITTIFSDYYEAIRKGDYNKCFRLIYEEQ